MEGPPGFNPVLSDGPPPYPSVPPLAPQLPTPANFHAGIQFPPQQGVGVVNMGDPALAAMNAAAPLLTMPAPSVPNLYLPNNTPFSSAVVYGPAQAVNVMTTSNAAVPFDPSTPPPFADRAQLQFPRRHGVLKIINIPYTISIPEMQQFICKYIPQHHLITPHVAGYPIHIIMERSTGKTMDCYVELTSTLTAAQDWEHAFGLKCMRIPKIGQRNVEVFLSNQGELMKDMFPRAKCIHFDSQQFGAPKLVPNRDIFSSGYKGFMTNEELTCMVRHAEYPQRSQFANRSMQRTFESMISTLYKASHPLLLHPAKKEKQTTLTMFDAYKKQLDVLIVKVDSSRGIPREVGLDNKLLMDFIFAGLNTPGFNERQRADIVASSQALACGFSISKHAAYWPFHTLSAHPANLTEQDVGMWLEILSIGMGVMEEQKRKQIGIEPYLEVCRDSEGHVLFTPTEAGLDLKRGHFSMWEKRFMNHMIELGWEAYLGQMGVEPPMPMQHPDVHHFNNNYIIGAAHINPVDPFDAPGSSNARPVSPLNSNGQESGSAVYAAKSQTDNAYFDDERDFEEEESGDNLNDPEKALHAMREVLKQVSEAPPPNGKQHTTSRKTSSCDVKIEGLGASLQTIEFSSNKNRPRPSIVGQPSQQRPAVSVLGRPFNPESPAFEPPPGRNPQHRHTLSSSGSTVETGTPFGGSGLGNGDFISPQRISTARHNNKGKGRETAAATSTAPTIAAGVRLLPAIFGPPLGMTYGRPETAQPNAYPMPCRERRGVTIVSPDDGTTLTALRPTPALETNTAPVGGLGASTLSPGRARNLNTTDGVHDLIDDLFGETTTTADRMTMDTPVMTPLSTPPSLPVTPLRRTIGRVPSAGIGPVEDDYDDPEVIRTPAVGLFSPDFPRNSSGSSNSTHVPSGAPSERGPGSGWEGYEMLGQDPDAPTRAYRRVAVPGFGISNLTGSPYPQRMTMLESTAEQRSYRQSIQHLQRERTRIHINETINEETEP
ncbi:uncharacterized protein Z519_02268 [Cladophialophora bantiana CBS 173.52]|uniref:Unplaced genomic scaffold supercont1.3, whole genome shotgun sequence n=1 Tax=Cladophialophora bantiana (strain ATCC 10958 / CBS 173.52 / CDC B-1940 / NIH 8579) TaxID=1442370 RepID=A0A0D2GET7_CLAB1|nr:uncharacterized protein Z519_02268 [Cladophialophora bantiana CBS 173.52]KIW96877.1 hypothetical protein Z519_02268 [Cladophialophora bantiana CBS 173.52]